MHQTNCVLMSALLMIADGLIVKGPSGPLVAPLGSSVVLPCSVDELSSVEDLEVEWKRTDSETFVHLFQDGESRAEAQHQDYQDRANFFTEEIQHGNFSLRLDNLRAEDEGQYICTVHSQEESGETVIEIKVNNVEHLRVSASKQSIPASVGEDVTLSCSVDSHIPPEELVVSWTKTDEDIVVLLYQDNEALPEGSNERYRDRVEFFTDEIPKGNFSLRLKSVRTEDKGVYMCEVFAGGLSANTTVELEQLGFSALHIMVLILCISASGSALLLCCLIYCRSPTKGLIVQNSSNLKVTLGGSVVLPCHVPPNLLTKDTKVEWRRTSKKSETSVHLFEDGEVQAEKQLQEYKERAHFFTEHIKHGNFSLRLKKLTTEDEGQYTCTVHNKKDCVFSAKTKLLLKIIMRGKFIPLGGSVDLPCQVDKSLLENSLKVEWKRSDSETLVHLYEDGKIRADEQHKDYQERAHFLKKKIKDGNFSICLKKLRAGDVGVYTCKVYRDQDCVHSVNKELKLGFTVKHSDHTTVPLGSSVVLPCYEDRPSRMESLKVEWGKKDLKDLVQLYEDGESQAEAQQQDYQNRAHLFTEHIKDGNFSLRLDNLKAEDEGEYKCRCYDSLQSATQFSTKINVVLKLLDTVFRLQMFLVFCPNLIMFLVFVLWGVSEGSLFETVSCCSLYFLRPLMLLWTAPYFNDFTDKIKTWVHKYSIRAEYIVFSAVFYSVLFKSAWDKSLNYTGFEAIMIIVIFVFVLMFNFIYMIYLLARFIGKLSQRIITIFGVLANITFDVLPSLQFIILFFTFGSAKGGFIIVAVLPVFLTISNYDWDHTCGERMGCSPAVRRSVYLTLMILVNVVMVYFYIIALENEKDRVGWACMIAFLQLLWAVINFTWSFPSSDIPHLVPVYVFGSVVVVLLNSVALMTELILKTVNGEGLMGDMRIVVFSSEFIFTLFLMILMVFEPWITPCLQSCQKAINSRRTRVAAGSQNQESQNATAAAGSDETPANGSNQNQNPAETHEMDTLLDKQNHETKSDATEETQPDSVVTQK